MKKFFFLVAILFFNIHSMDLRSTLNLKFNNNMKDEFKDPLYIKFELAEHHENKTKDQKTALDLFEQITQQDKRKDLKTKALYRIGRIYSKKDGNVPQDYPKALEAFKTASSDPNIHRETYYRALYRLGELHYFGLGTKQNFSKAYELLSDVARNKVDLYSQAAAFVMLGEMYKKGKAVECNIGIAKNYFMIAAKQTINLEAQELAKKALKIYNIKLE